MEARWRYHARWIAINLALIAATACVYRYYLIPRFILHKGETAQSVLPSGGVDAGALSVRTQSDAVAPTRPDQERRRAPPALAARSSGPTQPELYRLTPRAAELGYRCIGGIAYRVQVVAGVTHAEADGSARCR